MSEMGRISSKKSRITRTNHSKHENMRAGFLDDFWWATKNKNKQKWLEGKDPKKIIIVPKKIINIVV